MAKVKATLKELRNADVRWISLVDRAASRIAFRVLKKDKETAMGLDLTRILKGEQKPVVAKVGIFAQKSETLAPLVVQSIADAGFEIDRVHKAEGDADILEFSQGPQTGGEITRVKLSDNIAFEVRHMPAVPGFLGDVIEEQAYFPSLPEAQDHLETQLMGVIHKGESVEPVLASFHHYLKALSSLPQACFKADAALGEVLHTYHQAEAKKQEEADAAAAAKVAEEAKKTDETQKGDGAHMCKGCDTAMVEKNGAYVCEKCTTKADETTETIVKAEETKEAVKVETPVVETLTKADLSAVLDAITAVKDQVTTQVTELATKVENVVQKQLATDKALDETAKKAETLQEKLSTTVVAPARKEDRANGHDTVTKVDTDPRTGCFDTAMLRRSR